MQTTATLAGRTIPTATADTYVHGSRYLDAVCRANRAEARVAELLVACAAAIISLYDAEEVGPCDYSQTTDLIRTAILNAAGTETLVTVGVG